MKIIFLGTCSGTEPMPGRKHESVAIETNDRIYMFDAGEGCSYTAHLLGLDMNKLCKIVISHTHIDHVGGLANLLWIGKKLLIRAYIGKPRPPRKPMDLYLPNMETWEGIKLLMKSTEAGLVNEELFYQSYPVTAHQVHAGVVFDDGVMKVTAVPNTHVKNWVGGESFSYSYLIECEGKRLVYSGDVGNYEELDPLVGEGCDGLILETGHFGVDEAGAYAAKKVAEKKIGKLYFCHHGREILNHPKESQQKVQQYFGDRAVICWDGMIEEW